MHRLPVPAGIGAPPDGLNILCDKRGQIKQVGQTSYCGKYSGQTTRYGLKISPPFGT